VKKTKAYTDKLAITVSVINRSFDNKKYLTEYPSVNPINITYKGNKIFEFKNSFLMYL